MKNPSIKHHSQALYQLRLATRILAVAILIALVVGFFLPKDYKIERSVFVKTTNERLVSYLSQPENWPNWMYIKNGSLFLRGDSTVFDFDINYDSGKTGYILVNSIEGEKIFFSVMPKIGQKTVKNIISWQNAGEGNDGVMVTWTISGSMETGLLSAYLALFANDIAGSNFERGLIQLKQELRGH